MIVVEFCSPSGYKYFPFKVLLSNVWGVTPFLGSSSSSSKGNRSDHEQQQWSDYDNDISDDNNNLCTLNMAQH